jgi:hypothetical protein
MVATIPHRVPTTPAFGCMAISVAVAFSSI